MSSPFLLPMFAPVPDDTVERDNTPMLATMSSIAPTILRLQTSDGIIPLKYDGRPFLQEIVDGFPKMKKVFLLFGRQLEKTQKASAPVLLHDGREVTIKDIQVGDRVVTMAKDGAHTSIATVTWKSEEYRKPCVRIITRQGHKPEVAVTHPIRQWERWTEAGDLHPKDRIASIRFGGEFVGDFTPIDEVVEFVAFMIGDGSCGGTHGFGLTQAPGLVADRFYNIASKYNWLTRPNDKAFYYRKKRNSYFFGLSTVGDAAHLLKEFGLWGCLSPAKHIPDSIFRLDRRKTALFLNRLWATDGHTSRQTDSAYELSYSSISLELARGIQRLLWKFSIPTSIRKYVPKLYKGTDRVAYVLRVETREGVWNFLREIRALGKTEDLPAPSGVENNNRDTLPLEVENTLRGIKKTRTTKGRDGVALYRSGHDLRWKPKYPLTYGKLEKYVSFFRKGPYDQIEVDHLESHLTSDLLWDEIESIEDMGEQPCYDIAVEGTENFVTDGIITHNSTTLAALPLVLSTLQRLTIQYTSGTMTQANEFSSWKVDGFIRNSDLLKNLYDLRGTQLTYNRREKQSFTGSRILVGSAFADAARIRGVPMDWLEMDELELVALEVIPVLQHAMHHSKYKYELHAATPLSTDNTAWIYWDKYSIQHEWVVPCTCRTIVDLQGKTTATRHHWNILGPQNLTRGGIVCAKCKRPINSLDGMWAQTTENKPPRTWHAFRLPQIAAPYTDCNEIANSMEQRPIETLQESFALSVTEARQVFSDALIEVLSDPNIPNTEDYVVERGGVYPYFVGIDWGAGGNAATVCVLATYVKDVFKFIGGFRFFEMSIPEFQEYAVGTEIAAYIPFLTLLKRIRISKMGADAGMGFVRNRMLLSIFGPERFIQVQYTNQADLMKIKPYDLVVNVSRDEMLNNFVTALKMTPNKFKLPRMEALKSSHWYQDLKAVKAEVDRKGKIRYIHSEGDTDDFFHAMFNCILASHLVYPRADLFPSAAFRPE